MFGFFLLLTAFTGSMLASIWDLKTTEIPDEIPYTMMVIGLLIHSIESFLMWDYIPFLQSCVAGLSLLGLGLLMYYTGQWGGGDAKILSAIGFLLPVLNKNSPLPFPLIYLFNVFLIGSGYMILYAIVLSLIKKEIIFRFVKDVKASSKFLFISVVMVTVLISALFVTFNFGSYKNMLTPEFLHLVIVSVLGTTSLFLMLRFVKTVENVGFKTKIPISKLKVGDVLLESKVWDGITKEELKKIKKSGKKYVWIKEGVRFAPTFPLALAFTILYGDGIFFIMKVIGIQVW